MKKEIASTMYNKSNLSLEVIPYGPSAAEVRPGRGVLHSLM